MLFRNFIIMAVLVAFAHVAQAAENNGSASTTNSKNTQNVRQDHIPYTLHEEADRTDLYDIPVNNSEYDEEEEMEEMHALERKPNQK